jgi:membrane associated rhomboid family serine protease
MNEDLRMVFESPNRAECSDRALVLAAVDIPFQIVDDIAGCALVVPAEYSARAVYELMEYDEENPPRPRVSKRPLTLHNALPGLFAYCLIICGVAIVAEYAGSGADWYVAGRVDGALVRAGEWWRTLTALTLHSDLEHLIGNLVFGIMFGLFASRLLGSGIAWLSIVIAAGLGNALNTLLLEASHRAIGASTAVFAALGLVAGFVWRGKLMAQDRWSYRIGPIVGGFALLMYTGTGGERTDIGAHLMGFLFGLGGGMLLTSVRDQLDSARIQWVSGICALLLISGAWALAIM